MKENDLPVRLNITYITERIIAMIFPSEAQETTYKSSLAEISQVLKNKHEDNYLMINLSERRNDMHKLHKQVIDFGWPEALAPPLERLCNICKSIDSWLNRGSKNVVVIHCKGGLGRLAVVLSAYIDYNSICANEDQSLDQLSMKQFFESKLNGVIQPSQKRYVHYFAGLLSGAITINNNSLFLHQIVIRGIPNFDGKGGCQPYIKIYQGMKPVYMSGVFSSSSSSNQIIVTLEPCLQLRSDVLVKCYNKSTSHLEDPSNREMIFRCQFHTCAISNNLLKFGKNDLDEAYQDARFPSHGQVEFVLSDSSLSWNKYECQPYEKNVLIGTSHESVQRWNSYENFAGLDEDVTFEDVDGYSTERREFFDQNHSSKTFNETKSSWRQNVDSSSASKKLATSDKWNVDGMERRFNDQQLDSGNVFSTTSNQSRLGALKSASSREIILDEQSHVFPATLPPQSTAEQQQLDDILKELLEEPSARASSNVLAHRYEHAPPSHGTITTESDKMRTTLSWQTSQAGSTKSATVNRQTLAEPTPHSKLASEVTRYREVTGDEDNIVGGKLTSVENYSCRMPGFQETRKVEMLSESKIDDGVFNGMDQRFVPIGDSYASLQRQRSLTDNKYRTYSGRNYASDSEDQLAWLESQRNKLRATKDGKSWKNKSMQEKQLLAELKSAQGAYYKTKKAQSDTEDFDHSYRRSDYSSDSKMLPLYIQEYRDPKGRRCQTIETETYSKRCETTTNQFAGSQSNTGNAIINVSQKQLMPPPRSSTPSTPVIPDRGESSREAFLRNQYALKPIDFDFDTRSHASLPRPNQVDPSQPVEVEIVSLQPIGPGVQTLESGMPGAGTIQRTPAITYPSQGTLNRDYNMSSSVSVPTSLSNLQPTSSHLKTSISQTQNLQQPAPLVPGYQHQTLQKSYMSDNVRTDGMQTLPPNFTAQPVVQTYKETQTWSTTNNQPNTLQQNTLQPNTLQHLPSQLGGSVQHLNQQQTVHRTMTSSVDGRSVPILVERQDKPAVTHHPVSGTVMGQTLTRDSTQQQGFIQQQQQYIKQQQQQFIQQPVVARQDFSAGTMKSASSQNQLLVETHSPHLLGASAGGTRYRSLSSGGGGTFFTQQGTGTIRTRADSFSSAAGEAYEFINQTPKFIRDTSKMWHRPNFTREDATQYLKDKPPGSFVIRNSTTYPGSYGLTLRVAQVPSNVPLSGGDPQLDLVRHFIIEPTAKGVQLKGSANEPPFASLAAFVYQHSITPLSLPCKLLIPELVDGFESSESGAGSPQVSPSAACNVLYIGSLDTESLTGPEALSRALDKIFNSGSGLPKTQEVSFKASAQGITITDNKRRLFFRRHYPLSSITYLGLDNQEQKWAVADFDGQPITSGRVFGFVARKQGNSTDNSCYLFAELDASKQSAQTLINFITHIMVDQGRTVTTTST